MRRRPRPRTRSRTRRVARAVRSVRALRPASLIALVLGVVAGFAVGVVAGLVSGDPAPLWDYAVGRTEALPWREGEASAAGHSRNGAMAERGADPASSIQGTEWAIQVGAFARSDEAGALGDRLVAAGYPVSFPAVGDGAGRRFRVWVGPVESRERAREVARELHSRHELPTQIVRPGAKPGTAP